MKVLKKSSKCIIYNSKLNSIFQPIGLILWEYLLSTFTHLHTHTHMMLKIGIQVVKLRQA